MTFKTLLTALVLTVLPASAFAICSHGKNQQAMSCAEGTVWDSASSSCVAITSS